MDAQYPNDAPHIYYQGSNEGFNAVIQAAKNGEFD